MPSPGYRPGRLVAVLLLVAFASAAGVTVTMCGEVSWRRLDENPWSTATIAAAEAQGNALVVALDAYRAKCGRYPAALEELVPTYTAKIDPPAAGAKSWYYQADVAGTKFVLCFGSHMESADSLYPCEWYDSTKPGEWSLDS